jgi:hypothetical protein
MSPDPLTR